jgi:hypothetical protein
MLAFAVVGAMSLSVVAQEICTERDKQSLIYDPDEPPPCPVPMRDLVPSTIGRPLDYMAEALAGCAGMQDAILQMVPDAMDYVDFISGDRFFAAAMDRRERPAAEKLADRRVEGREYWLPLFQELGTVGGGSMFNHSGIACRDYFEEANGR